MTLLAETLHRILTYRTRINYLNERGWGAEEEL